MMILVTGNIRSSKAALYIILFIDDILLAGFLAILIGSTLYLIGTGSSTP